MIRFIGKVVKVGEEYCVVIPDNILKTYNIKIGDKAEVSFRKVSPKSK